MYIITSDGKVINSKGHTLSPRITNSGYYCVSLSKCNTSKPMYIHRLVALHYVPNPHNYDNVNHIDGNKLNNHYTNLEWCTKSQNAQHAIKMGLKVYTSVLTEEDLSNALASILLGRSYKDIHKEYNVNVPFLSTKVKRYAKSIGKHDLLLEALRLQKLRRVSNRDSFGRIISSATTIEKHNK